MYSLDQIDNKKPFSTSKDAKTCTKNCSKTEKLGC